MINPEMEINPQDPSLPILSPPPPEYATQQDGGNKDPPTGPVNTPEPPEISPPSLLIIMVKPGTITIDTPTYVIDSDGQWTVDPSLRVTSKVSEYAGQEYAQKHLNQGVAQSPNIIVMTQELMQGCKLEQIISAPISHEGMQVSEINPFPGYTLGYYVQIDTLVQGNYWEYPTTATATVTATITDSKNQVVYKTTITEGVEQGGSGDATREEAAIKVNSYFTDIFTKK
jgi:hypothetical protein